MVALDLPRVVIVDYYDSYTNNLLTLFTKLYTDQQVLAKVAVIKADQYTWTDFQRLILPNVDSIIISPGPGRPDKPKDIGFALELLQSHPVPILGVCLGHQAIAVAFGGKIMNIPKITHGHVSRVRPVSPPLGLFALDAWSTELGSSPSIDSTLSNTSESPCEQSPFKAVVYNSLVVDPSSIPPELEVTAWSEPSDGSEPTVQGLIHKHYPIYGVQYHPESISSTRGVNLISSFIQSIHAHYQNPKQFPSLPSHIINSCAYRVSSLPSSPPSSSSSSQPTSFVIASDSKNGPAACLKEFGVGCELVEKRMGGLGREMKTQEVFESLIRCNSGKKTAIGEVWLDGENVGIHLVSTRLSFKPTTTSLSAPTFLLSYTLLTRTVTLHRPNLPPSYLTLLPGQTFFQWFDAGHRQLSLALDSTTLSPSTNLKSVGWLGGWVGWFGYEMKVESLAGYEKGSLPRNSMDEDRADAAWAWSDGIVERTKEGEWIGRCVVRKSTPTLKPTMDEGAIDMISWLQSQGVKLGMTPFEAEEFISSLETILTSRANPAQSMLSLHTPAPAFPRFHPSIKGELHKARIDSCREAIRQGESYELNQTMSFIATLSNKTTIDHNKNGRDYVNGGDLGEVGEINEEVWKRRDEAYKLYLRLRTFNPAYYSCYLSFPTLKTPYGMGCHVLSSSPERFLQITTKPSNSNKDRMNGLNGHGNDHEVDKSIERTIEMRPIKGTRARVKPGQCICQPGLGCEGLDKGSEKCRAAGKEEDERRGKELCEDLKERAENLMIVDLIRSDLLSCCVPSTVKVPQLIALESYGVHNLVTTVKGVLAEGLGAVEAVKRCFPPGSMTGAPKLRSVQLLDEFEQGTPRGIYSGALGYFSIAGDADLSVVIRTIVVEGDRLSIGAGGAITWLSDRDGEWEEVLTKVQSVVGKLEGVA